MIAAIIDRIKAQCPSVKTVEHAFSLNDMPDMNDGLPAVYVAPLGDAAKPTEHDNFVRQLVTTRILIQIAAPASLIDATRKEVRAALLGFQPFSNWHPMQFEKGEVLDIKPRLYWWADVYFTSYTESQN